MTGLKVPRKRLFSDLVAGLAMAIISVPGSIANGVLAGVNPIFGLYSTIVGTTVAALFTSSVIMNVDTTGATALATGGVLAERSPETHLEYLVVLAILVGLFQLIFGLLKLGFLTDFISNAVMTGFITGIAVQAIIGQAGDLTGFYSEAGNKLVRVFDTVVHFREIDIPTLGIGLLTMAVILGIERTRYARLRHDLRSGDPIRRADSTDASICARGAGWKQCKRDPVKARRRTKAALSPAWQSNFRIICV